MPNRRQFVVSLVATAYSVIALAGHGLHDLAPCGDPGCCSEAVAKCSCGHDHAPAPDDDPQAFRAPQDGAQHDAHQCAFCALLAKVKVGHAQLGEAKLSGWAVSPAATPECPVKLATLIFSHAPRGPPMDV